jgi:hypothetical protein
MKRAKFHFLGILKELSRQTIMLNRSYVFPSVFLIATVFGGSAAIAQTEFGPPGYGGHYAGRIVRAVYGAQGKYADVTGIVRRFCTRWNSLSSLQSDFRHRSELWSA